MKLFHISRLIASVKSRKDVGLHSEFETHISVQLADYRMGHRPKIACIDLVDDYVGIDFAVTHSGKIS